MADAVVITRPWEQADALAERVAALGRHPVVFPLLEIHPLADPTFLKAELARLEEYALVAFVSPNAIGAAFGYRPDWPLQVPLAVMGEGSRAALAAHGVTAATTPITSPTDSQRTDSVTLLAELDLDALRGKPVLIIRGESGRELLADALRAAGVLVTQVAAYRRLAPVLDQSRRMTLAGLLEDRNDWIVTSSEALRYLARMAQQVEGDAGLARLQAQRMIVPHLRIQQTALELGLTEVQLTGSGDEHMLAALQSRP
jgi:uroporphyrinogen-III synthase